ncbi:OFCC1 [Branchiostoma lanceolatum]|uniref:OFCC1 protein n=1 Tax=Branchiostoma lanceolatum TaxID=7740 RepID=A0A8J9Z5T0_BRALA|nr:OFCC1 [Branchiostoma lanceolatum]
MEAEPPPPTEGPAPKKGGKKKGKKMKKRDSEVSQLAEVVADKPPTTEGDKPFVVEGEGGSPATAQPEGDSPTVAPGEGMPTEPEPQLPPGDGEGDVAMATTAKDDGTPVANPDQKDEEGEKKPEGPDSVRADSKLEWSGDKATLRKEFDVANQQREEDKGGDTEDKPKAPEISVSTQEPYDYDSRDFSNIDPKQYGLEFESDDETYEPPQFDSTLPDIYQLMDTLEGGESDLEADHEPPSLFSRPEHARTYRKITELKVQMEEEPIPAYIDEFEKDVEDDMLHIASISLEEVQEEEKRLRDEYIAYQKQEADLHRNRQEDLAKQAEGAKKRVSTVNKDKLRELRKKEAMQLQKERLLQDRLHKAFRQSENQLIYALDKRQGEVKTMYGDLTVADGFYGGSKGRRWKVDWNMAPQPIQVKLQCMRGVKDKLPVGRYVLLVSLYDRLGGHVMRWSNLKGQQWGGATLPVSHDGHFWNAELKFDQSVFTVLPPKPDVRPGMILTFELFLLRGAVVPTDRVVCWGSFPICDGQFDIIEGKYKCPFLRGDMDLRIDKHEKMEELMASDLDHWLGNLYFEVIKLPRYLAGQKEYEVELQFSAQLLSHPDRVQDAEENRDGEDPLPGSRLDLSSRFSSQRGSRVSLNSQSMLGSTSDPGEGPSKMVELQNGQKDRMGSAADVDEEKKGLDRVAMPRPATVMGSRKVVEKEMKLKHSDSEGSSSEDENDGGFLQVKGQPGMYYKRHLNNPSDVYARKLYTMLPKTPLLSKRRRKKRLTYLEQLAQHTFAVQKAFSTKGTYQRPTHERAQYITRMFLAEMGLSQWRSKEFLGILVMLFFTFFLRIFLHYGGQWLFLMMLRIPVNKFEFLPYTVNLNYQSSLLRTREEIALIVLGPAFNILWFSLLVALSWVSQRALGSFPALFSKFVMAAGLMAFLDPILILLVDCALQRWRNLGGSIPIGDAFKMWWHFDRVEGSGIVSVPMVMFLYIFTMFLAATILYMYFLRLHNNGRMLDIYHRLHGLEEEFFVPHDLELSNQELNYVVKRAEQWRGEEGERRKVAVYDYIWEEEQVEDTTWEEGEREAQKAGRREITTHLSIHTLHLDGLRELYRHFLRLPDGAIVEVFGDMGVVGMDKDVKKALAQRAQSIENLGSTLSLNSVARRRKVTTAGGLTSREGSAQFLSVPQAGSGTSLKRGSTEC